MVTAAYRSSYFNPKDHAQHGVGIASARAGNVIGGGDWASDRLIPDFIRAIRKREKVLIRNPHAIRPWQHVLDPLCGYLTLAQRLYLDGPRYTGAWNYGPDDSDTRSVEWIVRTLCDKWGKGASYAIDTQSYPHEAHYLRLDCSKARTELGWRPCWNLDKALDSIVKWARISSIPGDYLEVTRKQIKEYEQDLITAGRG